MSRDRVPHSRAVDHRTAFVRHLSVFDDDIVARIAPAQHTPRRYEQQPCDDLVMPSRKVRKAPPQNR